MAAELSKCNDSQKLLGMGWFVFLDTLCVGWMKVFIEYYAKEFVFINDWYFGVINF